MESLAKWIQRCALAAQIVLFLGGVVFAAQAEEVSAPRGAKPGWEPKGVSLVYEPSSPRKEELTLRGELEALKESAARLVLERTAYFRRSELPSGQYAARVVVEHGKDWFLRLERVEETREKHGVPETSRPPSTAEEDAKPRDGERSRARKARVPSKAEEEEKVALEKEEEEEETPTDIRARPKRASRRSRPETKATETEAMSAEAKSAKDEPRVPRGGAAQGTSVEGEGEDPESTVLVPLNLRKTKVPGERVEWRTEGNAKGDGFRVVISLGNAEARSGLVHLREAPGASKGESAPAAKRRN
jgi:hypothetical protein